MHYGVIHYSDRGRKAAVLDLASLILGHRPCLCPVREPHWTWSRPSIHKLVNFHPATELYHIVVNLSPETDPLHDSVSMV